MDPEIQKNLYAEADARFWAIAGYQPGHKLDPTNAIDKLMTPVWQAIYNEVLRQYHAGSLQWTMNHPEVASALATATSHVPTVEHALQAALDAPAGSPPHAQALQAATAHHDAAQIATKAAGAKLPSPAIVTQAVLPIAQAVVSSAKAVQQAAAATPPATVADAHRVIQATAAPKHAADVAKAHGLNFQMDAGGHGVLVGPGAGAPGVSVAPADLPPASSITPAPGEATMHETTTHVASSSTPWIAFGAVAAALGIGSLIVSNTPSRRRYRRHYDRRGYAR